jgi:hypothetical protein
MLYPRPQVLKVTGKQTKADIQALSKLQSHNKSTANRSDTDGEKMDFVSGMCPNQVKRGVHQNAFAKEDHHLGNQIFKLCK